MNRPGRWSVTWTKWVFFPPGIVGDSAPPTVFPHHLLARRRALFLVAMLVKRLDDSLCCFGSDFFFFFCCCSYRPFLFVPPCLSVVATLAPDRLRLVKGLQVFDGGRVGCTRERGVQGELFLFFCGCCWEWYLYRLVDYQAPKQ